MLDSNSIPRRQFLAQATAITSLALGTKLHAALAADIAESTLRDYLRTVLITREEVAQCFIDAKLPYVDLMQAHPVDAVRFQGTIDEALSRYFIGHYNPLGNQFCAFAIKNALVQQLDPPPPAFARWRGASHPLPPESRRLLPRACAFAPT